MAITSRPEVSNAARVYDLEFKRTTMKTRTELEEWIEQGRIKNVEHELQERELQKRDHGSADGADEDKDLRTMGGRGVGIDTELIQGLLAYRKGNVKGSIDLLTSALSNAERTGSKTQQLKIANNLLWIGLKVGMGRKVRSLFSKLESSQRSMDRTNRAFFLINHAYAVAMDIGFIESDRYSEKIVRNALEGLEQAEKLSGKHDSILSIRGRYVFAMLLQQGEQWDQAETVITKAIWSAQREKFKLLEADLLEERGNLHYRQAEEIRLDNPSNAESLYRKAQTDFEDALKIWNEVNPDQEGVLSSAIGDCWYRLGDYSRSLDHHERSYEFFSDLNYRHGVALQNDALGRVALRQGRIREGIRSLKKALKAFRKLDVRHEVLLTRVHLVDGYFLRSQRKGKKELKKLIYNEPVKRFRDCYRELKEVVNREEWLKDDPDLSELFLKPLPRFITLEVLEQIIQAAKRSHPNEFGALLHGDPVMDRLEFVLDSAKGTDTFMFSLYNRYSGDYMYADGSVHSHPSGAATPSKADLSFFGRFPNVNIIIGYPYALDSWAAYDRTGNRIKVGVIYRSDKEKVEARYGTKKQQDLKEQS